MGRDTNTRKEINMKTVDYTLIEKCYDERLSIQENLEVLRQKGIEVGKTSLYNYCKDKGIGDRLSDDELRHLIDPMQTIIMNLEIIKGKGYRISKDRISKILKETRNTYRPSDYEEQPKTEILSTPKPTLNDIVGLDKFLSSLAPNINEDLENKEKTNNVAELKERIEGEDLENKEKPVEEVKPTVQKDTNPLCNLKFDFAKLMGDF